jgi:hypothetical protein
MVVIVFRYSHETTKTTSKSFKQSFNIYSKHTKEGEIVKIYFQGKWAQGCWPKEWADNGILADITF